VLVPTDTPVLTVLRNLSVFGHSDPMGPYPELLFEGVRIPASHLLGSAGAGVAIGQARLGPARVHHCIRAIGACEVLMARAYSDIAEPVAIMKVGCSSAGVAAAALIWRPPCP
jgi:acyl-CoA dehydrogenase